MQELSAKLSEGGSTASLKKERARRPPRLPPKISTLGPVLTVN